MPSDEVVTINKDLAEQMLMITEEYLIVIEDTLKNPPIAGIKQIIANAKLSGLQAWRKEDAT